MVSFESSNNTESIHFNCQQLLHRNIKLECTALCACLHNSRYELHRLYQYILLHYNLSLNLVGRMNPGPPPHFSSESTLWYNVECFSALQRSVLWTLYNLFTRNRCLNTSTLSTHTNCILLVLSAFIQNTTVYTQKKHLSATTATEALLIQNNLQ